MDDSVVGSLRGSRPIEYGSIIANRYTVLRSELSHPGGMFVCREAGIEVLRSIWLNHPRHGLDPSGEKFLAELTKVSKLEHPQLRKVLDFGVEPNGVLYAVYEPLELRTLADVLEQDWPLADERIVWLTCQLLAALEVAHAAGVAHGDLRPENVFVRAAGPVSHNEEVLVCGLGLACSAPYVFTNRESRPHLQLTEWLVGTPAFAAPEQFRGEPPDARSDVYSAGLLLFQLLTRTAPFLAANDLDTAWMQCFTTPPAPSGYCHVSPALEAACLKALTKTPDVRYQSANEMRAALLEAQARGTHSSRTRLSRTSQLPSLAPAAGSSRKSSPSIVPAVVLSHRATDSSAHASAVTSAMDAETPGREPNRRKPSASLLIACSALAIVAALVLPELKLRERDVDAIVRAEPGETRREEEPAELPPIDLPARKHAPILEAEVNAAAPVAPPAAPKTQLETVRPLGQLSAAKLAAPVVRAPAAPAPRRVEPARARVRTIEKSVVAAESNADETATADSPLAVAIVGGAEPEVQAVENPPAQALEVEPVAEPAAAPEPQPVAAAPVAKAAPVEAPSVPAVSVPRPVVLATTTPKAPVPPAQPHDVSVVIAQASSQHGAVSNAALRGAFNLSALARCYRDAVQGGEQPARSANAEVEISTNMTGRITAARASGANLSPNVARCIEEAARLGRVREADTGELRATVGLTFVVR